jgi:hypothetical protein
LRSPAAGWSTTAATLRVLLVAGAGVFLLGLD